MSKTMTKKLIRLILIFLIYMFCNNTVSSLLSLIGFTNEISIMFVSDLIFFFIIVCTYKDALAKDYNDFIKKYSFKQKIWTILKYVILIFVLNILMGILTEIFFPVISNTTDENSNAIDNLFGISTIYTLFKTLVFATIAEELLFKKSIHECISNKIIFIIVSGLIYSTLNIVYTSLTFEFLFIDFLPYFLFSTVLSIAYLNNDNNIIVVILIKFFYNLIPTILLLMGAF